MSTENLLIKLEANQLAVKKRTNKRMIEGIKRGGKIALNVGLALSGVAVMGIGGPVASAAGFGLYITTAVNAGYKILFKPLGKDSMFVQGRSKNGEIKISQDSTNIKAAQKMKGFGPREKGAMMGLDLLAQFKNIQQRYEDKGTIAETSRDGGNNVYPQVFSTVTHGINIKTVEALEKLGYLQIERKEPKNKSIIFFEKMGFGQRKEAMEALKSKITGKGKEEHEVQMYDIALRLTDKQIDFEQIYKSYAEMKKSREESPQADAAKRIVSIFVALRNKNIDLETNELGETVINHKSQEPFLKRVQREQTNSSKKYRESVYIGDTIEQGTAQIQEVSIDETTHKVDKDSQIEK